VSERAVSERVDAYWARFLGVAPDDLTRPGIVVTQHAALGIWQGVWCFTRGESCVISAPPAWVARLRDGVETIDARDAARRAEIALGAAAELRVGPSYQGWLPPENFTPLLSHDVRRLALADDGALEGMREAATPVDWEHSGIASDRAPTWAALHGDAVVALGQLRSRGDGAVDPCVIAHPRSRGSGCGTRVVSAMVEHALSQGALVLYQTSFANVPALAIARRLGFEPYATLVAIRLRSAASPGS
jgi:GNAT superfamily N-acetyltransferase